MVGLSKRAPWAVVLAVLALVLATCAPAAEPPPQAPAATTAPSGLQPPASTATSTTSYPLTVTDSKGHSITLADRPKRIASLSAGHTEVFFAIGAGGQIAAVDKFSDYPPEAKQKTQLDAFQLNLEAVAATQPDLVLLTYDSGGIVEGLERLRIPFYFSAVPTSVNGVLEDIQRLGKITSHEQEAQRLTAEMRKKVDDIRAKAAQAPKRPRVFHELGATLYTVSGKSFVGDLYTILGAQNIAADAAQEYPQLTQEVIIQRDPEVIILADEGAGESPATVKARPGWSGVSAVKGGRIYIVDPDLVSRPGPRVVQALETLAKLLYPEVFKTEGPAY